MKDIKFAPLSEYGDHMSADEWIKSRDACIFIPDDGLGYWATETQESEISVWEECQRPAWATHVMWYNK